MKVKSESEVAQSRPTLRDPRDCSLPGSSIHGIFQARVLEWGAIAFSDGECLVEGKYIGTSMSRSSGSLGRGSELTKGQKLSFSGPGNTLSL